MADEMYGTPAPAPINRPDSGVESLSPRMVRRGLRRSSIANPPPLAEPTCRRCGTVVAERGTQCASCEERYPMDLKALTTKPTDVQPVPAYTDGGPNTPSV